MADEQLASSPQEALRTPRKYGTFAGVFTPTLLTILGVIMYLRVGWVIGNAGLLGGVAIILAAFAITGTTGLSLSTLVTNIRVGAGGAYSIISQSLGLEVGGAIGIPLYVSQALAVSMYIFGFRAGWLFIFPDHPALVVDLITFAVVFAVGYAGPSLAFRLQFIILAVIVASLGAIAVAAVMGSMSEPVTLVGSFPGAPEDGFGGISFWGVFAVFFPAATGIMAGANLSGDLEDPKRSIPRGTMGAIVVSLVVYLLLAYWLARSAPPEQLLNEYDVMVTRSAFPPAVLAGLLGATLSSALGSIVGAPRILQAIASNRIVPASTTLSSQDRRGEPRNATFVTGAIVLAALMLRNLNAIAPLITMFFLITYTMINVVVLVEQRLGLVSFRPLLRIPRMVPAVGAVGCLFAMFIVNPIFGLVAVALVLAFYVLLVRRGLEAQGDVRSGLFTALAEWAARRVTELGGSSERAWKPNLLHPVEDIDELRGTYRLVHAIAAPRGSVALVGLTGGADDGMRAQLDEIAEDFRSEGVFSTATLVESATFAGGVVTTVQALAGEFMRPNTVFLSVPEEIDRDEQLQHIMDETHREDMGMLLFARHPRAQLGRRRDVTLWVGDQGPDWQLQTNLPNLDLATLVAYKLARGWEARLTLVALSRDAPEDAEAYLARLRTAARLPRSTGIHVAEGLRDALAALPRPDISIFSLPEHPDVSDVRTRVSSVGTSCLFAHDSHGVSAIA